MIGLLSAHAALSRTGVPDDAAVASGLRAPASVQGGERRDRLPSDAESNRARQRDYYRLARKDCMALSERTRNACLAEARMLWGR